MYHLLWTRGWCLTCHPLKIYTLTWACRISLVKHGDKMNISPCRKKTDSLWSNSLSLFYNPDVKLCSQVKRQASVKARRCCVCASVHYLKQILTKRTKGETQFFLLRSFWFPVVQILANQIQRFPNRMDRALQAGSVCVCVCVCVREREREQGERDSGGRKWKSKSEGAIGEML